MAAFLDMTSSEHAGGAAGRVAGKPICEMEWTKPNYHKGANRTPINNVAKRLFDPFQHTSNQPTAAGLLDALYPSCQDSTIFKYLHHDTPPPPAYPPEAEFNVGAEMEVETTVEPESAPLLSLSDMAAGKETVQSFLDSLPTYTAEQITNIEVQTRGQAENSKWSNFRSGMITASNLKSVVTRDETLHKENTSLSQNPQPMVSHLMGYSPLDPNLPSLKYGRLMEPVARDAYRNLQEKAHRN
ncbi:hypothetical protein Bbelb_105470 [Branchiostoma belcheri]|nr:hypothetical protein Bbelb_105470 [Branchiostoma belcheri]